MIGESDKRRRIDAAGLLDGGPRDYLSWVIECPLKDMEPDKVAEWLEVRFPSPVDDLAQWSENEDDA